MYSKKKKKKKKKKNLGSFYATYVHNAKPRSANRVIREYRDWLKAISTVLQRTQAGYQ
jgi:hypothetical protein